VQVCQANRDVARQGVTAVGVSWSATLTSLAGAPIVKYSSLPSVASPNLECGMVGSSKITSRLLEPPADGMDRIAQPGGVRVR
jgi:hypothetical protein